MLTGLYLTVVAGCIGVAVDRLNRLYDAYADLGTQDGAEVIRIQAFLATVMSPILYLVLALNISDGAATFTQKCKFIAATSAGILGLTAVVSLYQVGCMHVFVCVRLCARAART